MLAGLLGWLVFASKVSVEGYRACGARSRDGGAETVDDAGDVTTDPVERSRHVPQSPTVMKANQLIAIKDPRRLCLYAALAVPGVELASQAGQAMYIDG
jgi:hypothetical protein